MLTVNPSEQGLCRNYMLGITTVSGTYRIGENVTEALERWRAHRQAIADRFGIELLDDAFVLSKMPDQSVPLNPDTLTSTFSKARDTAGMPGVHLHTLRHYVGTEISAEVSPADAAKVLGHANSRMILEVYGHATEDRQLRAAEVMGAAMPDLLDAENPPA